MRNRLLPLIFISLSQFCCTTTVPAKNQNAASEQPATASNDHPTIDKSKFSPELPEWVNEVLFYLENMAVHRKAVEWQKERHDLIKQYQAQVSETDIISHIQKLVQKAGTNHSFLTHHSVLAAVDNHSQSVNQDTVEKLSFKIVDGLWGYIPLSTYYGGSESLDEKIMAQLASALQQAEQNHVKGLIIDLSENGGGNLYPPLAGLSSILEDGVLGYFYDPVEKTKTAWAHKGGAIEIRDDKNLYWSFKNRNHYSSHLREAPKAIIIGDQTGSSGEFLLLSLASQKYTRVFGQKTAGFATGNEVLILSDGSRLVLTVGFSMDTKGNIYEQAVSPDVETKDRDEAISKATKWLGNFVNNKTEL